MPTLLKIAMNLTSAGMKTHVYRYSAEETTKSFIVHNDDLNRKRVISKDKLNKIDRITVDSPQFIGRFILCLEADRDRNIHLLLSRIREVYDKMLADIQSLGANIDKHTLKEE